MAYSFDKIEEHLREIRAFAEEQNFLKVNDISGYYHHLESLINESIELFRRESREINHLDSKDLKNLGLKESYFNWLEKLKEYYLFLRDLFFEISKGSLLYAEDKISLEKLDLLWKKNQEEILSNTYDFNESFNLLKQYKQEPSSVEVKHFLSPWTTYENQLETIKKQFDLIYENKSDIIVKTFADIRKQLNTNIELIETRALSRIEHFSTLLVNYKDNTEAEGIKHLRESLDKFQTQFLNANEDEISIEDMTLKIEVLPERLNFPISYNLGNLITRDIPLKMQVFSWIDTLIMPTIHEMEFEEIKVVNDLRSLISNITANIDIYIKDDRIAKPKDLYVTITSKLAPIENLLKERINEIQKGTAELEDQISRNLFISTIYQKDYGFINVPLQRTIKQFGRDRNRWINKVAKWYKVYALKVKNELIQPEITPHERIVQTVRSRKYDTDDYHYSGIFTTGGFPGVTFYKDRGESQQRIIDNIEGWKEGFAGAVLLHGNRFCGKTSLGEYVVKNYFPHNTVRLKPHSDLHVSGRKGYLSADLSEALNFVIKYIEPGRSVIWIDDLELWFDQKKGRIESIESLLQVISSHANKIFFLVSCNTLLKNHLDRLFGFSGVFQAVIELNKVPLKIAIEAVHLRHSATGQQLTSQTNRLVSYNEMKSTIEKIYIFSKGNLGDVLRYWSIVVQGTSTDTVVLDLSKLSSLPFFIDIDTSRLLQSIITDKLTTDMRLKDRFGPEYEKVYRLKLRKLIQMGLVERSSNGEILLNPLFANELGFLVDRFNSISE